MADETPAAPGDAGVRSVPVDQIGHPLADRVGTDATGSGWVVTESRAPVVFLSRSRANLLATALRGRRRPVLVTDELSVLTPGFAHVWRQAGGSWVVRDAAGGLRHGFDGRRLVTVDDAWASTGSSSLEDLAVNHLRPVHADALQLTAIVSVRHPARESTVLGGAVTALAEGALGAPPRVWGPHEPAGQAWDPAALTTTLREAMPDETTVFAAGPGLTATVGAQRTRRGVEELTHAHLDLGRPEPEELDRIRRRLGDVLARLAERAMPLIGLLLARPGRADLLVPPFLLAPPAPLAILVGAPAVRSFGLDVHALVDRFGARIVGRPRIPALLFDLGPFDPRAWQRLDEILSTFDPELLRQAMGSAGPAVQLVRDGRGGADAQP